ncbi:DUF6443 domain-containing protein [Flavobacterium sp. 3HN19-14]|uniref:DUF6443 domain-containing protein n=1 Tax=Flavobacterium sp. 3HN19-14 TaxID=3448133 RepID=UPI003EDF58D1
MRKLPNFPKNTDVIKNAILGLLLFLSSMAVSAKETKWYQSISGSAIIPGATVTNIDPELSFASTYMTPRSATYVILKIEDFSAPFYWYTYSVNLKVTPILNDGSYGDVYVIDLEVENNRYGGFGNFIDMRKVLVEAGARGASIHVNSITASNNETSAPITVTPTNITLSVSYEVERYYYFEPSDLTHANVNYFSFSNDLAVNWAEIAGAEEYELEWTWADNYSKVGLTSPLGMEEIPMSISEFEHNASRVTVKGLSYRVPLVYDSGYLIFRIRAVGRFTDFSISPLLPTIYKNIKYGDWDVNPTGINPNISDWNNGANNNIYQVTSDDKLNWQFQTSYAENGKKKDVVSYFDGSLRNRQTVTRINTSNKAIVGEVIYDEEGRAAIEVLPSPVEDSRIKYYPSLNKNMSLLPYSYQDFTPGENSCSVPSEGMSVNSGASKYYSDNNAVTNNFQDFVPKAENFPFSRTEYELDNTGRIKRKGGVGVEHQLNFGT